MKFTPCFDCLETVILQSGITTNPLIVPTPSIPEVPVEIVAPAPPVVTFPTQDPLDIWFTPPGLLPSLNPPSVWPLAPEPVLPIPVVPEDPAPTPPANPFGPIYPFGP